MAKVRKLPSFRRKSNLEGIWALPFVWQAPMVPILPKTTRMPF